MPGGNMSLLHPQFQETDQGAVDSMKAFSAYLLCICALVSMVTAFHAPPLRSSFMSCQQRTTHLLMSHRLSQQRGEAFKKAIAAVATGFAFTSSALPASALDAPKVPLYTQRTNDLQQYNDIGRGFKMLRPFGFNEFDGAGSGYAIKFASLVDIDENVIVGSTPATAGKTSIEDYGALDELGEKLAKKRDGKLISAKARITSDILFYDFQFENPLDPSLPRTGAKDKRPKVEVELYNLCVHKGRLWSVKATTNDKLFVKSETKLRNSLASFVPKL